MRLEDQLHTICYDADGRESFYREERRLTNEKELAELLRTNHDLIGNLVARCGEHNVLETDRTEDDALPLLDCIHLLVVNWHAHVSEHLYAVFWHLDIADDGRVNGAGFWTCNPKIVQTFVEVFQQRERLIKKKKQEK